MDLIIYLTNYTLLNPSFLMHTSLPT